MNLIVNDHCYPQTKLSDLPQLCSRIILGQDFMEKHKAVEFTLNGSLPKLTVCGVTCMNISPPSLFPNLTSDIKPATTPTRKFSKSNQDFIHTEVESLLQAGMIEKSQSPWRA